MKRLSRVTATGQHSLSLSFCSGTEQWQTALLGSGAFIYLFARSLFFQMRESLTCSFVWPEACYIDQVSCEVIEIYLSP